MKKTLMFLGALVAWQGSSAAPAEVPCTLTVTADNFSTDWTSIDANEDGGSNRFMWNDAKNGAFYEQNKSKPANDWIISPAVSLQAGKSYKIVAKVQNCTTYSSDKQDFTVYVGTEPTVAAMTQKVFSVTGFTKTTWPVDKEGTFTATETGDFNIGLNLTSKQYMGDFLFQSFTVSELVPMPGAATGLTIQAGAEGALRAILTWTWPTTNSLGGAQGELSGAKIYRGTSSTFSASETTLVGTLDASAQAGTAGTYADSSVPSSGTYYYRVIPFDTNGSATSSTSTKSPFIGPAKSVGNPTSFSAALVAGDDRAVELTWNDATASEGYVNPAEVTYTLTRYANGSSTGTKIAEGIKGNSFTDTGLSGLTQYQYGIKATYNGSTVWSEAKSNSVVTGGTLSLPYSNSFSSTADIALWTMFHSGGSTRDWSISSSRLNYWGGSTADAWAVTPAFELKAGAAYQVQFSTWVTSSSNPKELYLYFGSAPTAEAMTANEIFHETIASGYSATKTVVFSVAEDGVYNIGFRCYGPSNSNDIYVDDLSIKEIPVAPGAVETLTATAAAEGELKVDLVWTNPSVTTAGTALEAIDRVVVKRGAEVLETLADVAPGSEGSFVDQVPAAGKYTYSIVAYIGENASDQATAETSWVGPDTPLAPASVTASMADNGYRIVEFSAVSAGINGGYVGEIAYRILRNGDVIAQVGESPYVDDEADLPLANYVYSVEALSGSLVSSPTAAAGMVFGGALDLPYAPDFASADDFALWTLKGFKYNSSDKCLKNSSSSTSWAITPPLNVYSGTISVSLTGKAYNGQDRYNETIDVYLTKDPENPTSGIEVAKDIKFTSNWETPHSFEVNIPSPADDTPAQETYYLAVVQPSGSAMYFYLTALSVEQSFVTSLEEISAVGGNVRYFDLQGRELSAPRAGQVTIVKSATAIRKIKCSL